MPTRFFERISAAQQAKDFGVLDLPVKMPQRATKHSAGYDIYSPRDFTLFPGQEILIPTGYKVFMQPDEYLAVHPRSGQGFKYYVRLANTTGVIDADYYNNEKNEGHIWVKLRNESAGCNLIRWFFSENYKKFRVEQGTAICQAIFHKYLLVDGDSTESGEDRQGGFGSTGV